MYGAVSHCSYSQCTTASKLLSMPRYTHIANLLCILNVMMRGPSRSYTSTSYHTFRSSCGRTAQFKTGRSAIGAEMLIPIPSNVFNSQIRCSEPYLSTDRRTTYRPSRIQAYPLHRILSHYAVRRCRSSISYYLVLILLWYSCHGQDNGTATINVAYEDEHHHVAPCHLYPAVVHYIKKGHIFQTARCTLINPTDSIASVTYNGAQFWKQRSKALTRPASHTLPTSPSL